MSKFGNNAKAGFLASIPTASFDSDSDTITKKCKFNFAYFEKQDAGQDFSDWSASQLIKLSDKIKEYSKESLRYWIDHAPHFVIYGAFPPKERTDFVHPKHVPHQASWCRFRLESKVRLVGFVIPGDYHGKAHHRTGERFDQNVFYVVFLDANHRFYKTEKD